MNDILIRKAAISDIDDMVKLEQECFTTDQLSKENFRRLLKGNTADILVAKNGSEVVGLSVILFRKHSKKARMYSLAVLAQYRARGVALKLNAHLEKNAKKRGCDAMVLEVRPDNTRAIKFYEKLGYENWGIYAAFYEDGCDALRMIKKIS